MTEARLHEVYNFFKDIFKAPPLKITEMPITIEDKMRIKKYAEEMTKAATQLETLNGLYQVQLQSAERNAKINDEVAENNLKLKDQMQSLTSNLSTLNNVYGGMLSAMSNKG